MPTEQELAQQLKELPEQELTQRLKGLPAPKTQAEFEATLLPLTWELNRRHTPGAVTEPVKACHFTDPNGDAHCRILTDEQCLAIHGKWGPELTCPASG
jgi:hypothetical protein